MKLLRTPFAVLTLLALPGLGLGPRATADELSSEDLYEKVVKSCVFIVTPMKGGFAMGSGSLIDTQKRIVITNYHVVDENVFVFAQFPAYVKGAMVTDKKKYIENVPAGLAIKAKVLYRDKSRDLAIIELAKIPSGSPAIPLAKTSPRVGSTVWNIGSPGAVEQLFSITEGKVRAVGIEDHLVGGGSPDSVFRIKAKMVTATNPTNPGDSGGPMFNRKGEQVAVTESGRTGAQQVNFFVDVTEVRAFLGEKKITIKELSDEPDPKGTEAVSVKPKDNGTAVTPKDNGTATKPPAKNTTPATEVTPAATPEQERTAAQRLASARLFAEGDENRKTYIDKLNAIVKQYPATTAAKEAKKLLDGLK